MVAKGEGVGGFGIMKYADNIGRGWKPAPAAPPLLPAPLGPPLLGKYNGAHLSGRVRWELGLVGKRETSVNDEEKETDRRVKGASPNF